MAGVEVKYYKKDGTPVYGSKIAKTVIPTIEPPRPKPRTSRTKIVSGREIKSSRPDNAYIPTTFIGTPEQKLRQLHYQAPKSGSDADKRQKSLQAEVTQRADEKRERTERYAITPLSSSGQSLGTVRRTESQLRATSSPEQMKAYGFKEKILQPFKPVPTQSAPIRFATNPTLGLGGAEASVVLGAAGGPATPDDVRGLRGEPLSGIGSNAAEMMSLGPRRATAGISPTEKTLVESPLEFKLDLPTYPGQIKGTDEITMGVNYPEVKKQQKGLFEEKYKSSAEIKKILSKQDVIETIQSNNDEIGQYSSDITKLEGDIKKHNEKNVDALSYVGYSKYQNEGRKLNTQQTKLDKERSYINSKVAENKELMKNFDVGITAPTYPGQLPGTGFSMIVKPREKETKEDIAADKKIQKLRDDYIKKQTELDVYKQTPSYKKQRLEETTAPLLKRYDTYLDMTDKEKAKLSLQLQFKMDTAIDRAKTIGKFEAGKSPTEQYKDFLTAKEKAKTPIMQIDKSSKDSVLIKLPKLGEPMPGQKYGAPLVFEKSRDKFAHKLPGKVSRVMGGKKPEYIMETVTVPKQEAKERINTYLHGYGTVTGWDGNAPVIDWHNKEGADMTNQPWYVKGLNYVPSKIRQIASDISEMGTEKNKERYFSGLAIESQDIQKEGLAQAQIYSPEGRVWDSIKSSVREVGGEVLLKGFSTPEAVLTNVIASAAALGAGAAAGSAKLAPLLTKGGTTAATSWKGLNLGGKAVYGLGTAGVNWQASAAPRAMIVTPTGIALREGYAKYGKKVESYTPVGMYKDWKRGGKIEDKDKTNILQKITGAPRRAAERAQRGKITDIKKVTKSERNILGESNNLQQGLTIAQRAAQDYNTKNAGFIGKFAFQQAGIPGIQEETDRKQLKPGARLLQVKGQREATEKALRDYYISKGYTGVELNNLVTGVLKYRESSMAGEWRANILNEVYSEMAGGARMEKLSEKTPGTVAMMAIGPVGVGEGLVGSQLQGKMRSEAPRTFEDYAGVGAFSYGTAAGAAFFMSGANIKGPKKSKFVREVARAATYATDWGEPFGDLLGETAHVVTGSPTAIRGMFGTGASTGTKSKDSSKKSQPPKSPSNMFSGKKAQFTPSSSMGANVMSGVNTGTRTGPGTGIGGLVPSSPLAQVPALIKPRESSGDKSRQLSRLGLDRTRSLSNIRTDIAIKTDVPTDIPTDTSSRSNALASTNIQSNVPSNVQTAISSNIQTNLFTSTGTNTETDTAALTGKWSPILYPGSLSKGRRGYKGKKRVTGWVVTNPLKYLAGSYFAKQQTKGKKLKAKHKMTPEKLKGLI